MLKPAPGRVVLLGPHVSIAPSVAVVDQFAPWLSNDPFCNVPIVPQEVVLGTAFPGKTAKNGIGMSMKKNRYFLKNSNLLNGECLAGFDFTI